MTKNFWLEKDFNVFSIEGLEHRMSALQTCIQPKFQQLGTYFSTKLSAEGLDEFYPHVARHARRTVNPPTDSWVAFAPAKRGYKALPHFQIGLWGTHLFIIIAVIYENPDKQVIAERLSKHQEVLLTLPSHYRISGDHMKPEAVEIASAGEEGLEKLLDRLHTVKKAEFLIGTHLPANEAIQMSEQAFITYAEDVFEHLLPIYKIIIGHSS